MNGISGVTRIVLVRGISPSTPATLRPGFRAAITIFRAAGSPTPRARIIRVFSTSHDGSRRLASPRLASPRSLARHSSRGSLSARSILTTPDLSFPVPPPPPPRRLSRISGQAPYTPLVAGTRETAGDGALEMIDLSRPYLPYAYLVAAIDSPPSLFPFFPSLCACAPCPQIFPSYLNLSLDD